MVRSLAAGFRGPDAYRAVYGAAGALGSWKRAYGADFRSSPGRSGGGVAQATLSDGDWPLVRARDTPDWGTQRPATRGGLRASLWLDLPAARAAFAHPPAAGATDVRALVDPFQGNRPGRARDSIGVALHGACSGVGRGPLGASRTRMARLNDVSRKDAPRRTEAVPER